LSDINTATPHFLSPFAWNFFFPFFHFQHTNSGKLQDPNEFTKISQFFTHEYRTCWERIHECHFIRKKTTKIKYLRAEFKQGIERPLQGKLQRTLKWWTKLKNTPKKEKNLLCSLIRRITIFKMFVLSKATYRLNAILIKRLMIFFTKLDKNNTKIHVETQRTPNSQSNL
jgi:hypothetical protein